MDLVRHILFENPLPLWIVLGLAAIVAGVVWTRTGSRKALGLLVAFPAAAVLVGILAWAVETDYERLTRTLDIMAGTLADGNDTRFMERVSPEYRSGSAGKEELAAIARLGLKQVRATAETPVIRFHDHEATVTQVYHFVPAPGSRLPMPPDGERVTWEGTFAPDADGEWRLWSAKATHPYRMSPEDAARVLPRM